MEAKMRIFLWTLFLNILFSFNAFADDFTFTTNAFLDTGALPVLYTCDGKDVSPDVSWSNPPPKTKSYALIVSDPDAPGGVFFHWVVYNIPANTKELAEGITDFPKGTLLGTNSFNKNQYNGPCPPHGTAHTYFLTLYALDAPVTLPAGADGKTVLDNIKDHIIQKVQLSMVYSRWLK
jgi:Raf kinase inhibitor-like YbhB/YbcL family protein